MADAFFDSQRLQEMPRIPLLSRRPVGFPAVLPPLIGRHRDVAALQSLLRQPETHLITLTGPAVVGKTRLALAVAAEVAHEFTGGAAFVPLAGVADPALVLPAIAGALDVRETPERPLLVSLADAIRGRRLLLVLDNFEHLLPAAAELGHLLSTSPELTILVTSRAPLHLHVEQRFVTPPLALPAPGDSQELDAIAGAEAVALFIERARAVQHDFALTHQNAAVTAEICLRLDGLPLAIELAAAWVRVLPPAALLARLEQRLSLLHGSADDQPVRLRSMRDAIAWSYHHLSAEEQRLFRRLSAFVGGFTLEAAELLSPLPPSPLSPSPLDLLAALIDKSLVQPAHVDGQEPRYQMLETVREFALERLVASGEAEAIAAAHAATMLDFAERAEPVLLGPDELFWHARVDVELDNLRAALSWALEHDVETALRIGASLWVYWSWYHLSEGRRWLTTALDRAAGQPALVQARALTTDGALATLEGNFATGLERSRAAVVLASEAGDPVAEALARWITGCGYFYSSNRIEEAVPALEQALVLFAQASTSTERAWSAFARSHRATAAAASGDREQGLALFDTALAEARSVGSDGITLAILGDLAGWLINLGETPPSGGGGHGGELVRARGLLHEALALAMGRRGPWLMLYPLLSLALVDAIEGEAATAARRLGASDALTNLSGLDIPTYFQERVSQATALARNALGEEAFATLWNMGRADPAAVIAAVTARREELPFGLTRRQRDVLRLLADGRSDKEIAATLFVTRRTASKHVSAILEKLGVDSRTAAVGVALRHEVI